MLDELVAVAGRSRANARRAIVTANKREGPGPGPDDHIASPRVHVRVWHATSP